MNVNVPIVIFLGIIIQVTRSFRISPSLALRSNEHIYSPTYHHHIKNRLSRSSISFIENQSLKILPTPASFSRTKLFSTENDATADSVDTNTLKKYDSLLRKILQNQEENKEKIELDSLLEMDICVFTRKPTSSEDSSDIIKLELGAVQEDGTLAPLSAWTLESCYTNSDTLELLVDEEDRTSPGHGGGLYPEQIWKIWKLLDDDAIGYGSRQVGGGKGPGNPHGEESELLYYVERDALRFSLDVGENDEEGSNGSVELEVEIVVKPNLEILW